MLNAQTTSFNCINIPSFSKKCIHLNSDLGWKTICIFWNLKLAWECKQTLPTVYPRPCVWADRGFRPCESVRSESSFRNQSPWPIGSKGELQANTFLRVQKREPQKYDISPESWAINKCHVKHLNTFRNNFVYIANVYKNQKGYIVGWCSSC